MDESRTGHLNPRSKATQPRCPDADHAQASDLLALDRCGRARAYASTPTSPPFSIQSSPPLRGVPSCPEPLAPDQRRRRIIESEREREPGAWWEWTITRYPNFGSLFRASVTRRVLGTVRRLSELLQFGHRDGRIRRNRSCRAIGEKPLSEFSVKIRRC